MSASDPRVAPPFAPYDRRRTPLDRRPPRAPSLAVEGSAWTPTERVAFRFACAYCALYLAPFPLDVVPKVSSLVSRAFDAVWQPLIRWTGAHVLGIHTPILFVPTGSGDTMGDFVRNFLVLALAALAAIAWSALDRRRRDYDAGYDALRVYVRYAVAFILLGYGAAKVIKSQFPDPGLERLVEPYGQFSPMGVLWSFMGGSVAYNVFTGLGECMGAVLLFWRRTTTAGALLLIAVMANVVMLNFAYDVPVKLYSTNLLLFALLLALPDVRRLVHVLVLNRATAPVAQGTFAGGRCGRGWPRAARLGVKALLVLAGVALPFTQAWSGNHTYGDNAPKPPLYGIYDVDTFVARHDTLAPLVTDSVRWRRVIFGRPGALSVQMMSDSIRRFTANVDPLRLTVRIAGRPDSTVRWAFRYVRDGATLRLDGARIGARGDTTADSLHLALRRVDHAKTQLLSRGFHWVQQYPYNR